MTPTPTETGKTIGRLEEENKALKQRLQRAESQIEAITSWVEANKPLTDADIESHRATMLEGKLNALKKLSDDLLKMLLKFKKAKIP